MNKNPDKYSNNANYPNQIEWRENDMPYSSQFGDYYYSRADGRLECDHVFIKGNNLHERFKTVDHITIAELGFGTGLNFVETIRQFRLMRKPDARIDFHSFERYPLNANEIAKALFQWPELKVETSGLIAQWSMQFGPVQFGPVQFAANHVFKFNDNIYLHLHIGDANQAIKKALFTADAWYLDGFSPSCNKDMWSLELMKEVNAHTHYRGTIASYTAAGWVRKNLTQAGFEIKKLPGFAHKRDMICGINQQP